MFEEYIGEHLTQRHKAIVLNYAREHRVRVLKRAGIDTMEQLESMDDFESVRGIGHVISAELTRIVAEWRQTMKEPILEITVACEETQKVEGASLNIVMIPFTGTAAGPYFTGSIIGTGVDTQKIGKNEYIYGDVKYD